MLNNAAAIEAKSTLLQLMKDMIEVQDATGMRLDLQYVLPRYSQRTRPVCQR